MPLAGPPRWSGYRAYFFFFVAFFFAIDRHLLPFPRTPVARGASGPDAKGTGDGLSRGKSNRQRVQEA